jgi:polyferredoxin
LPTASIDSPGFRPEGSVLIRRLLYVAFFFEVGLLLAVLPWSTFWERNYFAESWPPLHALMTNNFVRGAVSGLGIVNLAAGVTELARVFYTRGPRDMSVPDGTPRS